MTEQQKSKRGFASMDPERRREIASKGGQSVPADKRAYSRDRTLAAAAGYKGGIAKRVITNVTELGCFLVFLAAAVALWIGTPA